MTRTQAAREALTVTAAFVIRTHPTIGALEPELLVRQAVRLMVLPSLFVVRRFL